MEKTNWDILVRKMVFWQWVIVASGLAMGAGIWLTIFKHLPPQIPLYYSYPWGEEQLADTYFLGLPLIIATVTAAGITLVVKKLNMDKVLAAIITGAGIIAEIILILAVLRTVILIS